MRVLGYCLTAIVLAMAGFIGLFTPQVHAAPLLKIVSPSQDQTILGSEATVSFVVGNAVFGTETHLHLWLDDPEATRSTATEVASRFDHVLSDLPSGKHTLTLEAVYPDHKSFKPRVMETVTFYTQMPQTQNTFTETAEVSPLQSFLLSHFEEIIWVLVGLGAVTGGIILYLKSGTT